NCKKSRPEKDGNDENKPPVQSPQKCSPKRVPEFRTRVVLRELQNQTEPKPIIDDVIIQPPPPPVVVPISDEVKAVRTHQPKKLDKTNVFNSVKNALHNSVPKRLIGRTSEIQEINDFINHHAKEQTAGSLYISGAPGTGKTACLSQVLSSSKISANFEKCISINCMSVRTASQIYQQIASEMGATSRQCKSARQALKFIENNLTTRDTMILLLLDEMDQLDSRNQEVLYTMFGWSALTDSKVILIGIANSLD
uniref:ORC1/DEAH AAA+ ATPase domain-containing protein n=1 Tax=Ciona savignyi TaxID=51511 RepID=H2YCD4_CIOSA